MDGHFVPNITIGPVVVESMRKVTRIPFDVYHMVTDPEKHAPKFIQAGAYWVSDPSRHLSTIRMQRLKKIRDLGAKSSIAVNPDVPLQQSRRLLSRHRHGADDDRVSRLRRPGFHSRRAAQDQGSQETRLIKVD